MAAPPAADATPAPPFSCRAYSKCHSADRNVPRFPLCQHSPATAHVQIIGGGGGNKTHSFGFRLRRRAPCYNNCARIVNRDAHRRRRHHDVRRRRRRRRRRHVMQRVCNGGIGGGGNDIRSVIAFLVLPSFLPTYRVTAAA